jgi:uncharacterized protein
MARNPKPATEVDLDALDVWLVSEESPPESMLLHDLDGFLTGIAAGPDLILPSEWMPRIWGGSEEPVFTSLDQASLVIGSIVGRYSQIAERLDAGPDCFDPLFEEGPEGYPIVSDWAAGFVDAVMLRPREWEALIRDEEMAVVFRPILLLGAEDPEHPAFGAPPMPEEALDALHEDAAAILTECVFRIRAFWREHAPRPAPQGKPSRRRPDPRRRR